MVIVVVLLVLVFMSSKSPLVPGQDYLTQNQVSATGVGPTNKNAGKSGLCAAIGGHVDRKNALAPTIAGAYTGLPSSVLKPLTNLAGKADVSAYAENLVGKVACSGAIGAFASTVAKDTVAAGKWVANETVAGAKAAGGLVVKSVSTPTAPLSAGANLAAKVSSGVSRAADSLEAKLPGPLKIAAAPAVAVTHVTATVAAAGAAATGALTSGVKSATSAVSSGVKKVLGWL